MKCSSCSAPLRPVVAIDIDGTLGDYHSHFTAFAESWLGRSGPDEKYGGVEPHSDWFCREFVVDLSTFRAIKLAYRQGGLKRMMPIYSEANAFVNSLRTYAEVWLTTTRPHDRFDRVDPDTREWLRRNGITYDGLLYSEDKMDELAERIDPERVCFVLDDLTEVLRRADELFPRGGTILRRTVYNVGTSWPVMTGSLLDARAIATAHVQDWALRYHFSDLPTTEGHHE